MRKAASIAILFSFVFGAGCSGQTPQSGAPQATGASVALTNPTDFPLEAGAKILDVKPFQQTVTATSTQSSALSRGAGTYAGNEVLAESTESAAQLRAWLSGVEAKPPTGYTYMPQSKSLTKYGISYGAFKKSDGNRGVVVVVMDPAQVKQQLGLVISLVDKYRALPASLRDPIDNQVKSKAGFSATEALDPSAPLGMTIGALRELQSSGQRAIIMVDASKK